MIKVLIADDSMFMRTLLKNLLRKRKDAIIFQAKNGQEAVDFYQLIRPDIVILDITMPVKDGLCALREIIELDKNATVIMCSSMGTEENIIESLTIGAKDFIVKPYFHNLLPIIEKLEKKLTNFFR